MTATPSQEIPAIVPTEEAEPRFRLKDYAILLKPRVMSLVVFTAVIGLVLAPGTVDTATAVIAIVFIALGAGSAGAINMWYDRDIDLVMVRTRNRPLPAGRISAAAALVWGLLLGIGSVAGMALLVNPLAAGLLALTIVYYVFIYTVWLKRRTPQNIVIGGASGALPPVIGWAAASGDVGLGAISLFLIIFLWTPPHSWALALFRRGDYEDAGVPMMPVVAGEESTRRQIIAYTALLIPATFVPLVIGLSSPFYGVAALILGVLLFRAAYGVSRSAETGPARRLFFTSILYLFFIFLALLVDNALSTLV